MKWGPLLGGEVDPDSRVPLAALSRRLYRHWERLACGHSGPALLFSWGVAESTVWPIVPDFLLLPVCIARRRRPIPLLATILGSALGGMAWHAWAARAPDAALRALCKIPLVRPDQIHAVHTRIEQSGPRALLAQPWSGIGLKVWAPVAASEGVSAGRALLSFSAARGLRFGLVSMVAAILARVFRGRLEAVALPLGIFYVAIFFPLWWRISTREYKNGDS